MIIPDGIDTTRIDAYSDAELAERFAAAGYDEGAARFAIRVLRGEVAEQGDEALERHFNDLQ